MSTGLFYFLLKHVTVHQSSLAGKPDLPSRVVLFMSPDLNKVVSLGGQ